MSHSTDLNASDISPASHSTEEGEEEEESVIVIWPNTSKETSAAPVSVSATEPRRNPSRTRKPLINGLIKGGGDVVTGQIYYDYDVI